MASPPRAGGAPRVECFARARLGLGGTALHQAALERETPDGVDALRLDDREDDVRILSAGSRGKICAKARGWWRSMRAAATWRAYSTSSVRGGSMASLRDITRV